MVHPQSRGLVAATPGFHNVQLGSSCHQDFGVSRRLCTSDLLGLTSENLMMQAIMADSDDELACDIDDEPLLAHVNVFT